MEQRSPSKIEIVKNIILEVFSFLEEEYYFTPISKIGVDNSFMESLNIEYINEIKRRNICICYTKNEVYGDIKYTFHGTIIRFPYSGIEDSFSLSIYLQSLKKDFSTSLINTFNEKEAEAILKQIAESIRKYCVKIIEGDEWFEIYYPRKD